ncbi:MULTISPECIES: ABC transporter permease subunit [Cryobacterium]|nr:MULTISPECIES: ABC transporter permease subunit [Cryobacterium]
MPLFTKAARDSWAGLLGWVLAIVVSTLVYLPLYRTFGSSAILDDLIKSMPQAMIRALNYDLIATGAGYVQATIFGLIGFIFLTIAAVSWGAQAVGGDEESGRLELTLAHAVTRTQIVLERALALVLQVLVLAGVTLVMVLLLNGPANLNVDPVKAVGTSVVFAALTLLSGAVALAVGAWTGRRLPALVAGSGIAVLGYALNGIGNQNPDLEWLHRYSPYNWAFGDQPLLDGVDWGAVALLSGLSLLLVALAVVGLNRRDISA